MLFSEGRWESYKICLHPWIMNCFASYVCKLLVSGDILYVFLCDLIIFHRTYFFLWLTFLCDICKYRSFIFIASARPSKNIRAIDHLPQCFCLRVSGYTESGKPLRKLACCYVFLRGSIVPHAKRVGASAILHSSLMGGRFLLQIHSGIVYPVPVLGSV